MTEEAGADAPEWVIGTQTLLGAIIKRPKLTPALLQKPPFRFLHDIVTEVTKATGFAQGLFDGDELQSAKIKEKEAKLSYLNKIIKCVEFASNSTIQIRPGKVVAGMEAENTNAFLQQLAKAATSGVDSASAVERALALSDGAAAPPAQPSYAPPSLETAAPPPAMPAPPPPLPVAPPAPALAALGMGDGSGVAPPAAPLSTATPAAPPPAAPPPTMPTASTGTEGALQQMVSAQPTRKSEEEATTTDETKPERPRTARRAPPKLASNEVKVDKPRGWGGSEGAPPSGVILEGGADDDGDETIMMVDQAGETVDTTSMLGEGGEGHGKLVRNLLEAKNEMEAADDKDEKKEEDAGDGGIILGSKKANTGANRLPTKTEINSLRATIQTLCQSCNPLGRCLEYVQEDMEAMSKELETWRALRRIKLSELADEESKTESSLVALQNELANVENQVKDKRAQIRFYKAAIVRNDATIERLLGQVVQAG
eukprot:CAMPEP_0119305912 /NCGR_PEP_ID=MMETSP1333-20130426/6794_1 /TAXON_ID=418940 /ORGANISM="Scyphosphaera apsteinii, Strain RCC1455" /LENGTH=484 /DNA_ID=CAMNT_0007309105 /DNA_START=40 /DNA_END=1494 /DNA_ORIENTATION=+